MEIEEAGFASVIRVLRGVDVRVTAQVRSCQLTIRPTAFDLRQIAVLVVHLDERMIPNVIRRPGYHTGRSGDRRPRDPLAGHGRITHHRACEAAGRHVGPQHVMTALVNTARPTSGQVGRNVVRQIRAFRVREVEPRGEGDRFDVLFFRERPDIRGIGWHIAHDREPVPPRRAAPLAGERSEVARLLIPGPP